MKEIHRVLRPGATFGMIWNIEDCKYPSVSFSNVRATADGLDNAPRSWPATTKWEQKMKDIIATLGDGHARFRDWEWKQAFEQQSESTPLQALRDTFTQNFPSFSLPLGEETVKCKSYLT